MKQITMKRFKIGDYVRQQGVVNSLAKVVHVSKSKLSIQFIYDKVYQNAIRDYSRKELEHFKYQEGDLVVYKDLVATIDNISKYYHGGICLNLTATEDEELTCTASLEECTPYAKGLEIDQQSDLNEAYLASKRIQYIGESLTDKNFRDGNH